MDIGPREVEEKMARSIAAPSLVGLMRERTAGQLPHGDCNPQRRSPALVKVHLPGKSMSESAGCQYAGLQIATYRMSVPTDVHGQHSGIRYVA